jgi:hypothetical protein
MGKPPLGRLKGGVDELLVGGSTVHICGRGTNHIVRKKPDMFLWLWPTVNNPC